MNWKGQVLYLLVHWLLPAAASLVLLVWSLRGPVGRGVRIPSRGTLIGAFLLSRVAYAIVLYPGLGYAGSGDLTLFHDLARPVLDGQVPGREYLVWYGPALIYLQALGLVLVPFSAPLGILLPSMVADAFVLLLGWRLGEATRPGGGGAWTAGCLLLTPLLWHQLVVRGAEESIFLATLLGGAWLLHRGRAAAGAAVLAFGFCATKVTYVPYALAVALPFVARRGGMAPLLAGALGMTALVYVPWIAAGADPLGFLRHPGETLWWLNLTTPTQVLPQGVRRTVAILLYAFATIGVGAWSAWKRPSGGYLRHAVLTVAAVHSTAMLCQPYVTVNFTSQAIGFLVLAALPATGRPEGRVLLGLLAGLGFLAAVNSATTEVLYQWAAAPLSLVVHGAFLWFSASRLGRAAPEGEEEAGTGVPTGSAA